MFPKAAATWRGGVDKWQSIDVIQNVRILINQSIKVIHVFRILQHLVVLGSMEREREHLSENSVIKQKVCDRKQQEIDYN